MGWKVDAHERPEVSTAKKLDGLPIVSGSYKDRISDFGQGEVVLSADYADIATILDSPNDVGSLLWAKYDGAKTDIAFYARDWEEEITEGVGRTVRISGPGVGAALDKSIIEPFDGTAAGGRIGFGDHIYGGRNIVSNPSLDEASTTPEIYELYNNGAGSDSFTLTMEGDTTASILWNASPATVETEIENTTGITNCLVTGSGTEADPWRIEFKDPGIISPDMTVADIGMTSTLKKTQEGEFSISPFSKSVTLEQGINVKHGAHASGSPSVSSLVARTGTYSLRFNGLEQFAGVQQVLRVQPGGTYQASVWAYTGDTAATWRFVIRTRNEELIAASSPFGGISFPANDWTQVSIADIVIPDGVTEVVMRFAYVGTGNPGPIHLDDWVFAEGMSAASPGTIIDDLLTLAQARGSLTWLTTTFTSTLDTAGNAWNIAPDLSALSLTAQHGKSLATVLRDLARRGVEWRVFWNGTSWELGLWRPYAFPSFDYGMGTDRTLDDSPALHIGQGVTQGPVKFNEPSANVVFAEGKDGLWTVKTDATSIAAWGRIETYIRDLTIDEAATLDVLAQSQLDRRLILSADKIGINEQASTPYVEFFIGDTIQVSLSPRSTTLPRRIVGIATDLAPVGSNENYEIDLDAEIFLNRISMQEATRRLLIAFDELETAPRTAGDGIPISFGGKHAFSLTVAASDAGDASKGSADYLCDGVNDEDTIQEAIEALPAGGGRVLLSEGTFEVERAGVITLSGRETLQGLGSSTVLNGDNGLGGNLITVASTANTWVIRDIRFTGTDACPGATVYIGGNGGLLGTIDGCTFAGTIDGPQVVFNGSQGHIVNNVFRPDSGTVVGVQPDGFELVIQGNRFINANVRITTAGTVPTLIQGNYFSFAVSGQHAIDINAVSGAAQRFSITNNAFYDTWGAISIEGPASTANQAVSITDNIITGGTSGMWHIDLLNLDHVHVAHNVLSQINSGIRVRFTNALPPEWRVAVLDNELSNVWLGGPAANGIWVEGFGNLIRDEVVVSGNVLQAGGPITLKALEDAVFSDNKQLSSDTLIENCDRIAINNNVWSTLDGQSGRTTTLEVKDCNYAAIEGNTIYGLRAGVGTYDAITLSGTGTENSVRFNRYIAQSVEGTTAFDNGLVIGASVSNTIVEHNLFDDATTAISDSGTGTTTGSASRETVLQWHSPKDHSGALNGTFLGVFPWDGSVAEVVFTSNPAQSGGTAQCDVEIGGTSVFSTGHPVIADTTQSSGWVVPDGTATGSKGDLITVDIDSASTVADYTIHVRLVEA